MATSSGSDHSIEQIVVPERAETSTLIVESPETCFRPTVSRLAWQETTPVLAPTDKIRQELVVPFTDPVPTRRAIRVTSAPVQASRRPSTCQPVNDDVAIQPVLPMSAVAAQPPPMAVPSSISRCSSGPICRICHDGAAAEQLLSPCKCCGTVGLVHRSCLEQWLCATGNDSCEICSHRYMLRSQKRSFREWLKRRPSGMCPTTRSICDMITFVLLTTLTVFGTWFCIRAALLCSATSPYSPRCRWETVAFCSLSTFLLLVYVIWCLATIRYHMRSFSDWQLTHQIVTLIHVNLPKINQDGLAQQPGGNASSDGQQPLSGNPGASGKTDNMELLPLQSHRSTESFRLGNTVTAQQLPVCQENLADGHLMLRKLPVRSISDTAIESCNSVNI